MSRLSSITRILRDDVMGTSTCASGLFDRRGAGLLGCCLGGARLLDQRQRQRECGPASPAVAGAADRAAHFVHGDRGRVEPEAVAVGLGSKAEAKDTLEVFRA